MKKQEQDLGLSGVRAFALDVHPDARGFFTELYRADWTERFPDAIQQSNLSFSYPGVVRAWHRHLRGQVDYFCVLSGAMRVCAYDPVTRRLVEVVAAEHRRMVVRVPGHYYHGSMTLGHTPSLLMYLTSSLYDHDDPDEERIPWNDPGIVPVAINGRLDDPRVGQSWNWHYPVHR